MRSHAETSKARLTDCVNVLSLLVDDLHVLYWVSSFNAILAEKLFMTDQKLESNFASEIAALRQQFDGIRAETESFLSSVKTLSDKGVDEAKEMIESAKDNWHEIKAAFEASSVAKFFSKPKAKKKTAKKKSAPQSKAKKLVKQATKKVVKKAAKKTTAKKKKK